MAAAPVAAAAGAAAAGTANHALFTMVSPQMCSDHGHDAGNLCDCDIFWGGSTCSTPFTSTIPAVQWGVAVYASIAAHAIVAVFAFLCLAHKWRACASCRGTNARDVVMGATCVASALRVAFLVDPGGMRGIYSPAVSSVLSRVPQVRPSHSPTHTHAHAVATGRACSDASLLTALVLYMCAVVGCVWHQIMWVACFMVVTQVRRGALSKR